MMVPIGIDLWASLRSPERFEPAMIPKRNKNRLQGLYNASDTSLVYKTKVLQVLISLEAVLTNSQLSGILLKEEKSSNIKSV